MLIQAQGLALSWLVGRRKGCKAPIKHELKGLATMRINERMSDDS
jgi:hypothetical protein